jgi:hypothetical protein
MDEKNTVKTNEVNQEKSPEFLQDEEYFATFLDDSKPRVSHDFAREEFARVLQNWKVLKKTLRKAKSKNKEEKEEYEGAKNLVIESIMDGTLEVMKNGSGYVIKHNLEEPIRATNGDIALAALEYKRAPKLVQLRKMDEFEDKEKMAKAQALAAALSRRSTPELANLSSVDLDVIAALMYFFV